MKLFDLLRPECVAAGLEFADKTAALHGIARLAKKSAILKDVGEGLIFQGLREREGLGSTGFGAGIAIPHCRLAEVPEFIVGIATAPSGVAFEAMDGKDVKVIVFIIAPARETNEHLRVLSAISHVLNIPGAAKELLAAGTPHALHETFLRHTRDDVDTKGHSNKHLIHLFVQNEDMFRSLLNEFTSMEATSVTVLESRNTREYLAKMPLFAGLLSDRHAGFSRTIVAVVEKTMTNEIIRRIEGITGHLDDCIDAMVTIQEVFYTAGSLEA